MSIPSDPPLLDLLQHRQAQLTAKLLEREPQLMREFLDVLRMRADLTARGNTASDKYAGYRTGVEATEALLNELQTWTDRTAVIDTLIAGGFGPHDERRRKTILDSLNYHTKLGRIIRLADDRIGLPEWQT